MTRSRLRRTRPRAALVAALVPLLVGALAAWADQPDAGEPAALEPPVATIEAEAPVSEAPVSEAPVSEAPVEVPEEEAPVAETIVTDAAETLVADEDVAEADAAPVADNPGPETSAAEAAPAALATTPVLQPGTAHILTRTITGASVVAVTVIGPAGPKRIDLVTPADAMSTTSGSAASLSHRLEPGRLLPDGVYRIILHNQSDVPVQFSYEVAWSGPTVSFAHLMPRPATGLLVGVDVHVGAEPLPAGTTGTVRAIAPDGTEYAGELTRDPELPERWRAYLGTATGPFLVTATFDTGSAVYADTWTTRSDSPDTTPPLVSYQTDPAASNASGWFARNVEVTLLGSDPGGSGVARIEWIIDGGMTQSHPGFAAEFTVGEGIHSLSYRVVDLAGNASAWAERTLRVDPVGPTVTPIVPAPGAEYELGADLTVDFACADALSGLTECRADIPDGEPLPTDVDGTHTFEIVATDRAGVTTRQTVEYRVVEPELPTVSLDMPAPTGGEDWYLERPDLEITGSDGTASIRWTVAVDGGDPVNGSADGATATFRPSRDGFHEFRYWAVDAQGRGGESYFVAFQIDTTGPEIDVTSPAQVAALAALAPGQVTRGAVLLADFSCSDEHSGVDECEGTVADGEALPTDVVGRHSLTVTATDVAGNESTRVVTYEVVAAPAAPGAGGAGGLAATGGQTAWLAALGLGLALVATGSVLSARRLSAGAGR